MPAISRYFELNAKNPQQKNAPIVYITHDAFELSLFFSFSTAISAEKNTMHIIAMLDCTVRGAEKRKIETTAVNTT